MLFQRKLLLLTRLAFLSLLLIACAGCSSYDKTNFDRSLFNTGRMVSGTKPYPKYDRSNLEYLLERKKHSNKSHEINLQIFDVINEAAVRKDAKMNTLIKNHENEFNYIPRLAIAHYKYAFGDNSQLDWLISEDEKSGLGRDSLILTVYGYINEWNRTILRLKLNAEYNDLHEGGGAAGEVEYEAEKIRKKIYGEARFKEAWESVHTH